MGLLPIPITYNGNHLASDRAPYRSTSNDWGKVGAC
jgi:hypothetical protein